MPAIESPEMAHLREELREHEIAKSARRSREDDRERDDDVRERDEEAPYRDDAREVAERARRAKRTKARLNRMHHDYDEKYAPEDDEEYFDEADRRRTRRSREGTKMRKADSHPVADRLRRLAEHDSLSDEHAAKVRQLADEIDASREDEDLVDVEKRADQIRKSDPSVSRLDAFTRARDELGHRRRAA